MRNLALFTREAIARGFLIACDHDLKVRTAERQVGETLLSGSGNLRAEAHECFVIWAQLLGQISKPLMTFVGSRFMLNPNWTWQDEQGDSSMRAIFDQAGIGERFRPADAPLAPGPVIDLRWNDERGVVEVVTAASGRQVVERITHQEAIDLRVKLDELVGRYGRPQ